MRRTRFDDAPCPIARTADLIGDWWTPMVMREAFLGRRRFDEFQQALSLSRGVLAQRLARLVDEGLLESASTRSDRPATSTSSPTRAAPSIPCSPRCGVGEATGCGRRTASLRSSCTTRTRATRST